MLLTLKAIIQKVLNRLGINRSVETKLTSLFKNKKGIEIGGPSPIFSTRLPIYTVAQKIDGCNFSTSTIWEGSIKEGLNYTYYNGKTGYQFISEASNLNKVESDSYDFLLASHCLEHCANTIKTMKEWLRVIKPGGLILLILPNKEFTFDHKRKVTSFEHLIEDEKNDVNENDQTHLNEILELHDLSLDLPAGDPENFKQRSLSNYENRCLHHHVFDFELLRKLFNYFDIKVKFEMSENVNQIIVGVK